MENKFFYAFDYLFIHVFTYILMSQNMVTPYFYLPYFHASNSALLIHLFIFAMCSGTFYVDVVLTHPVIALNYPHFWPQLLCPALDGPQRILIAFNSLRPRLNKRHFVDDIYQMHPHQLKVLHFDSNFIAFVPKGPNWWQTITWTNVDPVQ